MLLVWLVRHPLRAGPIICHFPKGGNSNFGVALDAMRDGHGFAPRPVEGTAQGKKLASRARKSLFLERLGI